MRTKVKFKEVTYNADGTSNIVFTATRSDCKALQENIEALAKRSKMTDIDLSLQVLKWVNQRSTQANAYFWELCDKLADELTRESNGKTFYFKTDLYKKYISEAGLWRDVEIRNNAVDTLLYSWSLQGVGWYGEVVDKTDTMTTIRLYYGSSCYNANQMSRLIDCVVQDCQAVGIEIRTPDEIAEMLSLMEGK